MKELLEQKVCAVKFDGDYETTIKKTTVFFLVANAVDAEGEDVKTTEHPIRSTHTPHKDFIFAMRELTAHALNINEMDLVNSNKADFAVMAVKMTGDLFMNQARVQLQLVKRVNRSKKIVKMGFSPQVTLSDNSNYLEWKDLKKKIEKLFAEAWLYYAGKHNDDRTSLAIQLDLDLGLSIPALDKKEEKSKHRRERVKKQKTQVEVKDKSEEESVTEPKKEEEKKPAKDVPTVNMRVSASA